MNDLISRQAALDIIDSELNGWLTDDERLHLEGLAIGISCLPTIDPVKHGKWNSRHNGFIGIVFECSECGQLRSATADWNYCPNCGADMRGEYETN